MPEFFDVQLRAIFRAATAGPTRLLLPMISSIEELIQVKEMIEDTKRELAREGIPHVERHALWR
jgi:phosphoenolpyruvate-protein kinase (PTS system EI component)